MNALKPIQIAVDELGKRDANLITADAILKFLFDSLRKNNDDISKEMMVALSNRIKERKNQDLVSLMKYLQTLDLHSNATPELPSSSKAAIIRFANELYNRLYSVSVSEESEDVFAIDIETESESFEDDHSSTALSNIKDRLVTAINAAFKPK